MEHSKKFFNSEKDKKLAAEKAVEQIQNGMKVGLGSGSTVYWAVQKLGERVKKGLKIQAVPTSLQTKEWAEDCAVPLFSLKRGELLDLTLDGADEIDSAFNIIKGGGGAHVREKITAASSKKFIIIAEAKKQTKTLGNFPVPVEIIPFEAASTLDRISETGCVPVVRKQGDRPYVSDNGNYIVDCQYEAVHQPKHLHRELKSLIGVVETGLFIGMADQFILAGDGKVEIYEAEK